MNNSFGNLSPELILLIIAGLALLVVLAIYFVFTASKRSLLESLQRYEKENADLQQNLTEKQQQLQNMQEDLYNRRLEVEQNQIRFSEASKRLHEQEQEQQYLQQQLATQQENLIQKDLQLNNYQRDIAIKAQEFNDLKNRLDSTTTNLSAQYDKEIANLKQRHTSETILLQQSIAELKESHQTQTKILEQKHLDEVSKLQAQQAKELQAVAERNAQDLETSKKQHEQAILLLKEEMRNASQELVKKSTEDFLTQSSSTLNQLTNPIKQRMEEFAKQAQQLLDSSNKVDAQVLENVNRFDQLIAGIQGTTQNLDKALRGTNKKVIGNWGEIQLKQLLEASGLQQGIHFETQVKFPAELTKTKTEQIPDFVINLPDNRKIIVDSKISFNAYVEAISANDKNLEDKALQELTNNILRHIKELKNKAYYNIKNLNSPQFVIMYVPIDNILTYVSAHRPTIFSEAMENNVVIASNATLLPLLSIVNTLWKNHEINNNTKTLAKSAALFFDTLSRVTENTISISKSLSKVNKDFNTLTNSLSSQQGALSRLKRFHDNANKAITSLEKLEKTQKQETNQDSVATTLEDFIAEFSDYIPSKNQIITVTEDSSPVPLVEVLDVDLAEEEIKSEDHASSEPETTTTAYQTSPLQQSIDRISSKLKAEQPFLVNDSALRVFASNELPSAHADSADTAYLDKKESDPLLADVNEQISALLNGTEEANEDEDSSFITISDPKVKENLFADYDELFKELDQDSPTKYN